MSCWPPVTAPFTVAYPRPSVFQSVLLTFHRCSYLSFYKFLPFLLSFFYSNKYGVIPLNADQASLWHGSGSSELRGLDVAAAPAPDIAFPVPTDSVKWAEVRLGLLREGVDEGEISNHKSVTRLIVNYVRSRQRPLSFGRCLLHRE